jgi:sialate O-acetylesterase
MKRIVIVIALFMLQNVVTAQLKLPSVFGSNMVLQQGREVNVWGWAAPKASVQVTFLGKSYMATADANGSWKTKLKPAKAGAAGEMVFSSGTDQLVLNNIAVGEVWVCSGQSNMEYPLSGFSDLYGADIRSSKDDMLRYVTIQNTIDNKERSDATIKHPWTAVDPSTVGDCSAVAYFFARKLRERLKVPVGLIVTSWGGTPAEAWMDGASLKQFPNYMKLYDSAIRPLDFSKLEEIKQKNDAIYGKKLLEAIRSFYSMTSIDYNDEAWEKTTLPKNWEVLGHPNLDGICAYRISFTLAAGEEQKPATLHLPAIDDIDSTCINGIFLGSLQVWNQLRTYNIPAGTLKAGKNVITIWVEDTGGGGGLNDDKNNFFLQLADKQIRLSGDARFKILVTKEDIAPGINYASIQNLPGVLFNAMIAPLLPYSVQGVIWYQGESNAVNYKEYRTLFPSMIQGWRKRWSQPQLPFLFVQLASYNPNITEPEESDWAGLREAQTYALKLPLTGMAVTTDVGDQTDIHPKRKKEVGDRLAANAFNIVYGFKKEVPAGPMFRSQAVAGKSIVLSFSNIGKGLMQKGDKLMSFAIAGADKHFVKADAVIKGNTVIVSSTSVSSPVYVRYAWADAPMDANLYNKDGFPAAPFRTDK